MDADRSVTAVPPRERRVGLVLGAGGIRGCAHAGVLAVLTEADVPIDLVVGTSVGSLFGLAYAAGLPPAYLRQVAREATPLDMVRFYAGRLRADRGNPIARMVAQAGEGRTFEDLAVPFAVTATDMETGRPVVLNRGPVLPAVQASIALPFVARPVAHEGRFLMDGGLLDTAPVWVARALSATTTVAVCLGHNYSAPRVLRAHPWTHGVLTRLGQERGSSSRRPWAQLQFAMRLSAASFDPPVPGGDADVLIWPHFGGLSPNSPFGAAFCYEQGVREATRLLPEIVERVGRG